MAFASYLGQFDVDAETNRVLDVALEMTRAALGLARAELQRASWSLRRLRGQENSSDCEGALLNGSGGSV